MNLGNKGRRNNINNNQQNTNEQQNNYTPPQQQPPINQNNNPNNLNYFNDESAFNESAFQPAAQSTYYQPPTPQQQHRTQTPQNNFFDPSQQQNMNNNHNYNNNQNNQNSNFSNMLNSNQQFQHSKNQNNQQNQLPQGFVPGQNQPQNPQQQQNGIYNPADQLFNDPMANMAVKYGSSLAGQGKEYVTQNVDRWFSISKLKFYFAVDTTYVTKKLFLILIPFLTKDWSMKYSQDEAVPPKLDVNAPDLYIPIMSFVTYILIVGITLGTQEKFTPEQLGIQASSALGWFIIEVIIIIILMQILSIKSALKTFDIMSFCGYKYFGMIFCLIANLMVPGTGYYIVLGYMCLAITYFMVRNLKLMILASENDPQNQSQYQQDGTSGHLSGNKRRIYVLLFISLLQPLFMWWLTRHFAV